jgi:hypothetical protein
MRFTFEPVTLGRQPEYLKLLDACPVKTSDYSFVNLWSWADIYGLMWAWTSDLVWIKQTYPQNAFWAPVGAWDRVDWRTYADDLKRAGVSYIRVPETLVTIWQDTFGDKISSSSSRAHWDYLYSISELQTLKGNRFHKKKNLLNQFKKKYGFEYMPLNGKIIALAADMQESWCVWRDCESNDALDAENTAIAKVLANWQKLERLTGGAIMIGSDIVAYTVAEYLTDDTLLIHFEKGDPAFKGVYQAINQMFLERVENRYQIVNREQDLGDEGLRKSKLSYQPIDFMKKYTVTIT